MSLRSWRGMAAVAPVCLIAACGLRLNPPSTVETQNARMLASLAPDIARGNVAIQPAASGTEVSIQDQALFPNNSAELSGGGRLLLAYVIEGLLAPRIVTVGIADSSNFLAAARARAVSDFFGEFELGQVLVPAPQPGPAPQTTAITVTIYSAPVIRSASQPISSPEG